MDAQRSACEKLHVVQVYVSASFSPPSSPSLPSWVSASVNLAVPFLNLDTFGIEVSGNIPSLFKELCRPINSNSAQYYASATYYHR